MKAKKKFYAAIILVVLIVLLLISYLLYIPPLLDDRGYNLPGRIYDFFAYAYYSSRMEWLENGGRVQASRRAAARAAWYRPSRAKELQKLNPDKFFSLGQRYAALGLDHQAVLLFRVGLANHIREEDKALEIISYLAILGDWKGTAEASEELLKVIPESSAANYWRGRALLETGQFVEAMICLQRAYREDRSSVDALFQQGRINENSGKTDQALTQYKKVVAILPDHLGAWEALKHLYRKRGETIKQSEADSRVRELTPGITSFSNFQNKLTILGYNLNRNEMETEDLMSLSLFLRGWRLCSLDLEAELSLTSRYCWSRFSQRSEPFSINTAGEVVIVVISWKNPIWLNPTSYKLKASFPEPGYGKKPADESPESNYSLFGRINLKPRWIPSSQYPQLVKSCFDPGARTLGKRTYLGPGSEIELKFEKDERVRALGLISYTGYSNHLTQDKRAALIQVQTKEGEELVFPIRSGVHTAEVWWDGSSPSRAKHSKAPIFRSWAVNRGKLKFNAHEYYAVFNFPRPLILKSLKIKYLDNYSGLHISDLVVIPENETGN